MNTWTLIMDYQDIRRESIYDDVIMMYENYFPDISREFPFRIKYVNERATDTRGKCRDMFSYFWENAYIRHFDGERLLVPAVHLTQKWRRLIFWA